MLASHSRFDVIVARCGPRQAATRAADGAPAHRALSRPHQIRALSSSRMRRGRPLDSSRRHHRRSRDPRRADAGQADLDARSRPDAFGAECVGRECRRWQRDGSDPGLGRTCPVPVTAILVGSGEGGVTLVDSVCAPLRASTLPIIEKLKPGQERALIRGAFSRFPDCAAVGAGWPC